MTNHSYFRFDDHDSINHYRMKLNCPLVLETHENLIPTGRTVSVQNSKYDFLHEKQIDKTRLDTPFVIDKNTDFTAKISSPISGITMKVDTNQPAVVVYTPLDFPAICFETQNYPDAPNNPHFPSSELRPGETYCNKSIFTFDLVP